MLLVVYRPTPSTAELARQEAGTSATWAIRNRSTVRVLGSADDELRARASVGARVQRLVALVSAKY